MFVDQEIHQIYESFEHNFCVSINFVGMVIGRIQIHWVDIDGWLFCFVAHFISKI